MDQVELELLGEDSTPSDAPKTRLSIPIILFILLGIYSIVLGLSPELFLLVGELSTLAIVVNILVGLTVLSLGIFTYRYLKDKVKAKAALGFTIVFALGMGMVMYLAFIFGLSVPALFAGLIDPTLVFAEGSAAQFALTISIYCLALFALLAVFAVPFGPKVPAAEDDYYYNWNDKGGDRINLSIKSNAETSMITFAVSQNGDLFEYTGKIDGASKKFYTNGILKEYSVVSNDYLISQDGNSSEYKKIRGKMYKEFVGSDTTFYYDINGNKLVFPSISVYEGVFIYNFKFNHIDGNNMIYKNSKKEFMIPIGLSSFSEFDNIKGEIYGVKKRHPESFYEKYFHNDQNRTSDEIILGFTHGVKKYDIVQDESQNRYLHFYFKTDGPKLLNLPSGVEDVSNIFAQALKFEEHDGKWYGFIGAEKFLKVFDSERAQRIDGKLYAFIEGNKYCDSSGKMYSLESGEMQESKESEEICKIYVDIEGKKYKKFNDGEMQAFEASSHSVASSSRFVPDENKYVLPPTLKNGGGDNNSPGPNPGSR